MIDCRDGQLHCFDDKKSKFLPKSIRRILWDGLNSADTDNAKLRNPINYSIQQLELTDDERHAKRRWFSIVLSWITIFTGLLQFSMFSSILGPFLSVLEPGISKEFTPWAVVAYSLGQMITPPLFGLWSNKIKQCRLPICAGLVILISGSISFCCLEAFPKEYRKWAMLAIRVVVGLGGGMISVPRNYCATASTKSERPKAVAGSTAALGLSVIAGPGAQAAFSFVGYPGVHISHFHLHMYNAPAFASIFMLLLLLILNSTLLLEKYPGLGEIKKHETDEKSGHLCFNERPLPKYDKIGAWASVWCWFCIWTTLTNFVILGVPFTQAQFDWSLSEAILYNGCIFGAFAITSLTTYTLYAFFSAKLDDRTSVIVGSFFILAFYMITFPWPGYSLPKIVQVNVNYTSNLTMNMSLICKYTSQDWCLSTPRIPVALFMSGFALMAIGFPLANSSLSILLAKILGPRRQGTMQGVYVTTGGFARLLGPLLISFIFYRFGPQWSWAFSIVLISSGVLCGIVFKERFVPLNPNPKLKPGDSYHYKLGVVYRF